jgi:hypothetical protein
MFYSDKSKEIYFNANSTFIQTIQTTVNEPETVKSVTQNYIWLYETE